MKPEEIIRAWKDDEDMPYDDAPSNPAGWQEHEDDEDDEDEVPLPFSSTLNCLIVESRPRGSSA